MKYFIGLIFVFLTLSCETTDKKNTSTYFGGEIINPKSNFVLFLKNDKVIDTLLLDKNNRFFKAYNTLKEGLYTFKHGNEFQYIYLEPTDEIYIRLNTWDFDESLVFTGKGSNKNEFLINLFLQNEKEEKQMYNFFKLNEKPFEQKLDSLINERINIYNQFSNTEPNLTDGFKKLTNAAIHYPLYRLKEIYPYYHKKAHKLEQFPSVSTNFYNFRDQISLNEKDLLAFYSYQNYIVSHLYNLAFSLEESDSSKNNLAINILNIAEEKIELEDLKNTLQKKVVVDDFLHSASTCTINEEIFNLFNEYCTEDKLKQQVQNLVNDTKYIKTDMPFQNFEIASYTNEIVSINNIIKGKNAVVYFWNTEFMSPEYLVKRVKYLEKKFPNIHFIGINMHNNYEDFSNEPILKKLNINNQYKLTKNSAANHFITSNYPRTIIVNKNGIVENGFTLLNSKNLWPELNKLK